jgi:hypothetical protein
MSNVDLFVQELLLAYKKEYHTFLEERNFEDHDVVRGGWYVHMLLPVCEAEDLGDELKLKLLTAMIKIAHGSSQDLAGDPNIQHKADKAKKFLSDLDDVD